MVIDGDILADEEANDCGYYGNNVWRTYSPKRSEIELRHEDLGTNLIGGVHGLITVIHAACRALCHM